MAEIIPAFIALQYQSAAHLRDPKHAPAPAGIEARRLKVYADLIFNNIESLLAGCFPVLRAITDDAPWQAMVRDFLRRHRAHTPLFPQIPREFLGYLADARDAAPDPAFLRELAHYEWLELAVALDARELDASECVPGLDLLNGVPVLNPLVRAQAYQFPVHRISPDYRPVAAPADPTYLLVFRNRRDEVGFMELNPVSARLIDLLSTTTNASGAALLAQIAEELKHPRPEVVIAGGRAMLSDLHDRDVLLGARNPSAPPREASR